MTSKTFRTLTDSNGNSYQFDSDKFDLEIKKRINILREQGIYNTSKSSLLQEIADQAHVSFEAVRNWTRGNNGPSSYDLAEVCAQVLDVEPSSFLIPLESKQEIRNMNPYDIELIQKIYSEMIDLVYSICTFHYANEKKAEEALNQIKELHRIVDRHSLCTSSYVRYQLHRILLEFCELVDSAEPARWYDVTKFSVDPQQIHFREIDTRSDSIELFGFNYIWSEIELAEELSFMDCKQIPQAYFDEMNLDGALKKDDGSYFSKEEIAEYGIAASEYSFPSDLSNNIIIIDQMVSLIQQVFKVDFPELETEVNK